MENTKLLNQIISKGGLIAACAEIYINDEEQSKKFLIECSEQCHNKSFIDYLGQDLIMDIIKYAKRN